MAETETEVDFDLDLNTIDTLVEVDIDKLISRIMEEAVEPVPANRRILVQVYLPHVREYGHAPMMSLVYAWPGGPLSVGDLVLCPPTPLRRSSFAGVVISLDASKHPYKGPVKKVIRRMVDREEIKGLG